MLIACFSLSLTITICLINHWDIESFQKKSCKSFKLCKNEINQSVAWEYCDNSIHVPGRGHPWEWWWDVWQDSPPREPWNMESRQTESSCEPWCSDHHMPGSRHRMTSHLWDVWRMPPCWSGSRSISGKTVADHPFFWC